MQATRSLFFVECSCAMRRRRMLWLPPLLLVFCEGHSALRQAQVFALASGGSVSLSFVDLVFLVYQGIPLYVPSANVPFQAPAFWLTQQLYVLFLACGCAQPQTGFEAMLLVHATSRRRYWQSRQGSALACTLLCYLEEYGVLFLLAKQHGAFFTLSEANLALFGVSLSATQRVAWSWYIFGLPLLVSLSFCICQSTLSLRIGTLPAFLLVGGFLACAAFDARPVFLANAAMPLRSALCCAQGGTAVGYTAWLLALAAIFYLGGALFFKRMNVFLAKEGKS